MGKRSGPDAYIRTLSVSQQSRQRSIINERIDLENVNRYLAEKNKDIDDDPYKLFHVILAAIVKTLTLRPKMNYFIKGYRTYKRPTVTLAFVVKKKICR